MTHISNQSEIAAAYNDWAETYDVVQNQTRDLAAEEAPRRHVGRAERHQQRPVAPDSQVAQLLRLRHRHGQRLVGEDGHRLAEFWFSTMQDETRRDSDRLEASRLLADRGWGKAPTFAAIEEEDPLGLEAMEQEARAGRTSSRRRHGCYRSRPHWSPPTSMSAGVRRTRA